MKHSRRLRPSPALVIACLALFVALGGTVLAATKIDGHKIRIRSLPGNRLEVGTLAGNRLQPRTIPGNRIAPGSLKGEQIDVGTLGQVPNAAHADSADTARRATIATAADHATDATTVNGRSVGCEPGKRQFGGACWDSEPGPLALTPIEAAGVCAAEGGELPAAITLAAFARSPGVVIDSYGEWTDEVGNLGAPGMFSVISVIRGGQIENSGASEQKRFRCVTPLLH